MGFECFMYRMKRHNNESPYTVEKIDKWLTKVSNGEEPGTNLDDETYNFYEPLFKKYKDSYGDEAYDLHIYQEVGCWCSAGRIINEMVTTLTGDNYNDCLMHSEITPKMLASMIKILLGKLENQAINGYVESAVFYEDREDDISLGYRIKECDGFQIRLIDSDKPCYSNVYNTGPITILDNDLYEDLMRSIKILTDILVETDFETEMIGFSISY